MIKEQLQVSLCISWPVRVWRLGLFMVFMVCCWGTLHPEEGVFTLLSSSSSSSSSFSASSYSSCLLLRVGLQMDESKSVMSAIN